MDFLYIDLCYLIVFLTFQSPVRKQSAIIKGNCIPSLLNKQYAKKITFKTIVCCVEKIDLLQYCVTLISFIMSPFSSVSTDNIRVDFRILQAQDCDDCVARKVFHDSDVPT